MCKERVSCCKLDHWTASWLKHYFGKQKVVRNKMLWLRLHFVFASRLDLLWYNNYKINSIFPEHKKDNRLNRYWTFLFTSIGWLQVLKLIIQHEIECHRDRIHQMKYNFFFLSSNSITCSPSTWLGLIVSTPYVHAQSQSYI